ncbi:uncharacterized protein LOC144134706 [Amblyomma americanum]
MMRNFSHQVEYWMLPPTMGIRRRPVFSIGLHDYGHRPHGILDLLEIVGGMVLWVMMTPWPRPATRSVRLLSAAAFTFTLGTFHIVVSSLLSAACAYHLPRTFYYIVFNVTGACCYLLSSSLVARDMHRFSAPSIAGLCTGGLHGLHFVYTFFKLYVDRRDHGWL